MSKFCTNCGRPLIQGQVCECQKPIEPATDEPWRNEGFKNQEPDVSPQKPLKEFNPEKFEDLWYDFKNKVGIGEPETNTKNAYERNMNIVPDCIKADEGEIPIKQYTIAKLRTLHKFHWAEGRLQVTNKRVIFRAPGKSIMGRTVLQHEFAIDEIAGIEARKEPAFGFFEFLFSYLVGGLGLVLSSYAVTFVADKVTFLGGVLAILGLFAGHIPQFTMRKKFFLKSLLSGLASGAGIAFMTMTKNNGFATFLVSISMLMWWVFCIANSFRTNLVFTIKTKGATGAVEIRRKKRNGLLGLLFPNTASENEEYTGFSNVFPMKDTEKAIREVGAMISDIQKFGDYGIEKWKEQQ